MQPNEGSVLRDWLFLTLGILALILTLALVPDRNASSDRETTVAEQRP
jgi:hypothetical protein